MFKIFGEKPEHPMCDLAEAKRLLAELPLDNPRKALEDMAFWLDSIKDASGFRPEVRTAIIMLMDDAGRPIQTELLQQYLSAPHLQDFQGLSLWRDVHAFSKALAEAYSTCVHEIRQADKRPQELIPLLCVRQLCASAELMKLDLMRYIEIDPSLWQQLSDCYRFAEEVQCAESMIVAYPGHTIHTSPQRELVRALVFYVSSPGTLAADQIEVSFRIAGRLVSFFDLKAQADADCPYAFDLSTHEPPQRVNADMKSAHTRFFGAVKAQPAVLKIVDQNENDPVWQEHRSSSDFTPDGKLTVLRHLHTYWAQDPPHRHNERRGITAMLEVTHGFRLVSQLVTHIDVGQADEESDEEQARIALVAADKVEFSAEVWAVSDASSDGLGATLTSNVGGWVKIGDLCGLRPQNGSKWWVGMVRRLHRDADGKPHVGVEILARKPVSVWLRALGKGAELASNWESSSGSFQYSYLPVILLPDEHDAYLNATMLMESGSYVFGNIYQAMMGAHSRDIRLKRLIAEGEDYEQVEFEWLGAGSM